MCLSCQQMCQTSSLTSNLTSDVQTLRIDFFFLVYEYINRKWMVMKTIVFAKIVFNYVLVWGKTNFFYYYSLVFDCPILRACECTGAHALVSDVKSRSECEMAEPVCSLLMKLKIVSNKSVTLAVKVMDRINSILLFVPFVTSDILTSVQ